VTGALRELVLDTSAVAALLFNEPDAELYEAAVGGAGALCMSTATLLECSLVLEARHGPAGVSKLDALIAEQEIELVPFDPEQLAIARAAFRRFGRGRHPAGLNFGDCFAYALARSKGLPLLFKGADFAKTDIESAI
jgi:ribonuclease VapC